MPLFAVGTRSLLAWRPMGDVPRRYDLISPVYDFFDWPLEAFRYRRIRRSMCGDLAGRVLEAGVGTGKNLPYYLPQTHVTAIDLSEGMLARAGRRARRASCRVDLELVDATNLPYPDHAFDAAVATYLFCVLPDERIRQALHELLRVTKPGGQVRILEHQYSPRAWRRAFMKGYAPLVKGIWHSRYDHPVSDVIRSCGAKVLEEKFVISDVEKLFVLSPNGNGARPVSVRLN